MGVDMKTLQKYAVDSQTIFEQIQDCKNVVTKSSLLDILKGRAERRDFDSLCLWLNALHNETIKRGHEFLSEHFDIDFCMSLVQKYIQEDNHNAAELDKEVVQTHFDNYKIDQYGHEYVNFITMFITSIVINSYYELKDNKVQRNELKFVSDLFLYEKVI